MKLVRSLLIFNYGLFTIASQALLFREFITTFEGNDISVGIFFASWFLWVGLGATIVYRTRIINEKLLKNVEFLFLSYLPAFVLQLILIIQARELAGIKSYELWSVWAIVAVSIIVNSPVSIITGMLFPITCRWIEKYHKLPVSKVYICEAAGSFVGGLGVTVLLGFGMNLVRIFFILAFLLSISAALSQFTETIKYSNVTLKNYGKVKAQLILLIPVCIILCYIIKADQTLMHFVRVVKWTKLLPAESFTGSFQTAQAEYLYGVYQNQWIVMCEGSVIETLPNESTAGRIAAIGLSQKPDSNKVLVIGSGLGLCQQFLRIPQIRTINWSHCDNEYVQEVKKVIPPEFKIIDNRLHRLDGDIRLLLAEEKQAFDIVILNLPDATNSVLNRFYTLEFYRQIKSALKPRGIFQIRMTGGENIMGTELINLGASTKLTLEQVFSKLVITPGEDTWFIASDSENLTGDPGTLRDRFASIEGASEFFTPQALLSVYLPERADAAIKNYLGADLPKEFLVNRDSRPLTHLYSLLLAAKQSGAPITKLIKYLVLAGPLAFIIPVLVFVVLRVVYILRTAKNGNASGFDSGYLVFSTGCVSIGVVIVLMYLYQTRFGSLYQHIGIVSSMFMIGLTIGAVLTRHLLTNDRKVQPEKLLFVVILVHSLILSTIAFWPTERLTHLSFGIAFILCGLFIGGYFPIAAKQLSDFAFENSQVGSKLETADHIGASAGGLLTSLALVPILGARTTLLVFILLIMTNVPAVLLRIYNREKVCSYDLIAFKLRRLGYIFLGLGISIILSSNLLTDAGAHLIPPLPQYSAQALAGGLHIEQNSTVLQDRGQKIDYFRVQDANDNLIGYIFSSEDLAPEVRGFGGKINLAIYVNDNNGELIDFHIIRSNETPAYLELLGEWQKSLNKHQLFQPEPFAGVHTVTGATVSSEAILSALRKSGRRFAAQIFGRTIETDSIRKTQRASYVPDNTSIYLIGTVVLTLVVIYRGGFWSRLFVLCLNLVLGGVLLNAQYSSEQITTILSGYIPAIKLTGAFMMVIGVPVLVIICGNIYCGYICPFGAAQELLSYVLPQRFKQPIQKEPMQKARFVKYVVLFTLVIMFFICRDKTTLAADPLISIFSLRLSNYDFQSTMFLITATALMGSIFYRRFWCRYLCPAGAFLSLLNHIAILKRYLPTKRFGKCEFGLTTKDKMDCIQCDRCRYIKSVYKVTVEQKNKQTRVLIPCTIAIAIFISAVSVNRFLEVLPIGQDYSTILAPSGGQPRDIDIQRVRTMIEQKKLSNKEAEFYKKLE